MADTDTKNPAAELPSVDTSEAVRARRREFVRKAATIGLPVVLATVSNRTVWVKTQATTPSVGASAHPSA